MTRKMYQLPLCLHSSNYVLKLHLLVSFSHHEEPYDLIYQGGYSGIGPKNGQLNCNRIVLIVDWFECYHNVPCVISALRL